MAWNIETARIYLAVFGPVCGEEYGRLSLPRRRDLAMDHLRRIEAPALVVLDNGDVADEEAWRFLRGVPRPGPTSPRRTP